MNSNANPQYDNHKDMDYDGGFIDWSDLNDKPELDPRKENPYKLRWEVDGHPARTPVGSQKL